MRRPRSLSFVVAATLAVGALALANIASAQPAPARGGRGGPSAPPPTVLNLGSFGIAVQNLDASVAFYKDGLGLDLISAPSSAIVDEARNTLMGTRGAKSRSARFAIPNEPFAIELVEYTGVERTPMMARHNDPGASFLNFGYVDIGAAFDAVRRFNPRMVGTNVFPAGANPGGGLNVA